MQANQPCPAPDNPAKFPVGHRPEYPAQENQHESGIKESKAVHERIEKKHILSSCYVHIPFCRSICHYCAFERTASLQSIEPWLDQIIEEASEALKACRQNDPAFHLKTLYFGGGTPSVLSIGQLARLAEVFWPYIDENTEWTMEINPDSMDLDQLKSIRSLGINRLSIGVQSFVDENLQKMNRKHTAKKAVEIIEQVKQAGFSTFSVDLIYGLPWTDQNMLEQDLCCLLQLGVPHVSIYSLQIEENSVFGRANLQPMDEDLEADLYELICRTLKNAGYIHYEISSFAKEGHESRHNLAYWSDQPYLGIGFGASGYTGSHYYHHAGTLSSYLKEGSVLEEEKECGPAFCALMMGLRTRYGVDLKAWSQKYQIDPDVFGPILQAYPGKLKAENGRLVVSEAGMEILNSILVDLLETF